MHLVPVILAGGSGTRLWPVSRAAFPKHLVELVGDRSLLQQTAGRATLAGKAKEVVVVAAEAQAFLVSEQLRALDPDLARNTILEPSARNTAAAIALAALHVSATHGPAAVLWICPSDHLVLDPEALLHAVEAGSVAAAEGWLVTFGIAPQRPETGFGYIRPGSAIASGSALRVVDRFIEKPPLADAEAMLAGGDHLWNSGMFLMRADRVLEELAEHEPALLAAVEQARDAGIGEPVAPDAALYAVVKSMPIDKAIMERSARVAVVPCDPRWSDIGSWQALWELMPHDGDGNAIQGDVLLADTADTLVRAERRLVAVSGVSGLAIVETADAVLVADRRDGEALRRLVGELGTRGRREAVTHSSEIRPWGRFTELQATALSRVRELVVTPGARLSLQRHHRRAEHWIVVSGRGVVELNGNTLALSPGQTATALPGTLHRMSNPGPEPLRLIEVQTGDLDGDDHEIVEAPSAPST